LRHSILIVERSPVLIVVNDLLLGYEPRIDTF
jgi:hypothetical protein